MKILFVLKQKKNVDTFFAAIRALVERGHSVALALQERSDERDEQYRDDINSPRFTMVRCPAHRTDDWGDTAWLLRSLRDCAHYQQPALRGAAKLQARTVHKLREELRVHGDNDTLAGALRELPPQQIQRLEALCALAEHQLPRDPLYDEFLRAQAPDVLLVSPLVHFGSAQADFVASARALGIPVGMLLYSWDNLSTKGCLHQPPDQMFVWNERQRTEAHDLHGFPEDRVTVVGAPRFDSFFELVPRLTRAEFHEPLGLDGSRPTLMYVCSSQFVSEGELGFVRTWMAAIRSSPFERLRESNIIIRPHPDIALLDEAEADQEVRWPSMPAAKGHLARPFGDDRAIVLRTSNRGVQMFCECIAHSAAVVGLNTSAELEAAIVGRPVYTVLAADADADGQSSTLHFHYLLEEHGGFVRVGRCLEEHVAQLDEEIRTPTDPAVLRRFVGEFLRPHGIDRPVAPILAEAIERAFDGAVREETVQAPRSSIQPVAPKPRAGGPTAAHAGTVIPVTSERYGYALQVYAARADSPGGPRYPLDRGTVMWLRESIEIGDVVYDVHAGNGLYAMLAAKHHGAVVVAFEPGYSAFTQLCDNLRLNGCDGSVMPLQVALADFEGMGELKYPTGLAGQHRHTIKPRPWRVKRSAGDEGTFKQPVYTVTLDRVVERCDLPSPNHLRLGNAASAVRVLAGAHRVLGLDSLKTIFFTLPEAEGRDAIARLAPLQWVVGRHIPISSGRAHVVLVKAPAPATAGP